MADDQSLLGSDMPPAFTPTGEYIPEAQLSQHLAKGTATFRPGAMVPMVAPDGSLYQVPSESAIDTLNSGEGWQLDSPEARRVRAIEQTSEEHPIIAGIAAAANEAASVGTFGQSDIVSAGISKASKALGGPDIVNNYASDIESLKKANPTATFAGAVGGALIGGAESMGGRGVKAAAEATGLAKLIPGLGILETGAAGETGLLTRAGASATKYGVAGAAEGAALGAGQETARQMRELGNQDMAVEKILMEAGKGAEFGGAFGGLLGGVGRLGGDVIGKSMSGLSRERQTFKALGATDAQIAKIFKNRPPEQVKSIVTNLLEEPGLVKPFSKLEDVADRLEVARERTGQEIGTFLKKIDEIPWYKPDKAKMLNEVDDLIGEIRSQNVGPDNALARELERQWRPGLVKAKTAEDIQQFRIRFDKYKSAMWRREQDSAKDAFYRKFSSIVEKNLETDVQKAVDASAQLGETGLVNDYLRLKAKQQAFIVADEDIVSKALARHQGGVGEGLQFKDIRTGGIGIAAGLLEGMSGPAALGLGVGLDIAKHVVQSRTASAIIARAADRLRGGLDASTARLSGAVGQSLTQGSKALVQAIPAATGKVLTRYQEASDVAQQARANPPVAAAKIERAVAPIGELDPNLAGKMTITLNDDLKWLTSKLPPPGMKSVFSAKELPGGGGKGKGRGKGTTMTTSVSVGGNATRARLSLTDMAKFNRSERALGQPLEALSDMKDGRLAAETVEMLRDRRPYIREQIANDMNATLAEMSKTGKVPTRTMRVQMSLATGKPLDATMTPEFISSVQNIWKQERDKAANPPQQPPRRETSRGMRDRAKSRLSAGDSAGEDQEIG